MARKSQSGSPKPPRLDETIEIIDGVMKFILICVFAVPIIIGALLGFTLFGEDSK